MAAAWTRAVELAACSAATASSAGREMQCGGGRQGRWGGRGAPGRDVRFIFRGDQDWSGSVVTSRGRDLAANIAETGRGDPLIRRIANHGNTLAGITRQSVWHVCGLA